MPSLRQKFNVTFIKVYNIFRPMLTMWLIYEICTSDALGRTPRLPFGLIRGLRLNCKDLFTLMMWLLNSSVSVSASVSVSVVYFLRMFIRRY